MTRLALQLVLENTHNVDDHVGMILAVDFSRGLSYLVYSRTLYQQQKVRRRNCRSLSQRLHPDMPARKANP